MNLFLTQSPQIGAAKAYLLRQALSVAAKKSNHTLVEQAKEADLVIVVGPTLPNSTDLVGKKVFLINEDAAFASPEMTLTNALEQAVDYVQPSSSVAGAGVKNIVAVTACPTGVAHTFMSAEAIDTYAKKQGWQVKVETRGQVGAGNEITPEEVAAADLVFVAADIDVPLDKFQGKPMYRTSTGLALKKTAQEFDKAFKEAKIYEGGAAKSSAKSEESGEKKGVYKHLMTGVSHMLPLVVAGGLLIAISFMFGIEAFKDETIFYGIPKALMGIGGGASKAAQTLSDYYIKRAEQYHPVIPIGAGNEVTVVFQDGFQLKTVEEMALERTQSRAEEDNPESPVPVPPSAESHLNGFNTDQMLKQLGNLNPQQFMSGSQGGGNDGK